MFVVGEVARIPGLKDCEAPATVGVGVVVSKPDLPVGAEPTVNRLPVYGVFLGVGCPEVMGWLTYCCDDVAIL